MPFGFRHRILLLSSLSVVVGVASLAGCGESGNRGYGSAASHGGVSGWAAYFDRRAGFTLRYPAGWHVARKPVAPGLFDPRERFAVATYAVSRWPEPCVGGWPGRPGNLDLGPRDAFVTVQERGRNSGYNWIDF